MWHAHTDVSSDNKYTGSHTRTGEISLVCCCRLLDDVKHQAAPSSGVE